MSELGPLPEPSAWRSRYRSESGMIGSYPWSYEDVRRKWRNGRTEYESQDLYTAEQMQAERERCYALGVQAGNDAVEQACALCAGVANQVGNTAEAREAATYLERQIRALKR